MATENHDPRPGDPAPIRIGDAERERMTQLLQRHMAAGRLDMAEYERRVEHATSAIYEHDLDGLLDDLPPIGEDGEPVGPHDRGRSRPFDDRSGSDDAWWSPPFGSARSRPPWGRRGFPFPLLALVAVALVVATHGWILFPLLFLFFVARGGGCGPRQHRRHGQRYHREHVPADDRGGWDRPQWPGRFDPTRDDQRM